MYSYKQSRRREDDLAIVNAGLRVVMEDLNGTKGQLRIGDCTLVYGGMSKTTVMASNTQQALIGRYTAAVLIHLLYWWNFNLYKGMEWGYITGGNSTPLRGAAAVRGCPWGHARVPQVSGHLILLQVLPDSLPPPLSSLSPSTSPLCHTQIPQVTCVGFSVFFCWNYAIIKRGAEFPDLLLDINITIRT